MGDLIKVVKESDHSLISNYHLRDKRLSWSAKGLLSTMLALSGEYTRDELMGMSRNELKSNEGFVELEECGYLTWRQCGIDSDCPKLEYTIYEKPISKCSARNSVAEIMDPEDMPVSQEAIDEVEKQKLRERLWIDNLVKQHVKGDNSIFICTIEVAFCELCKRDADFRNMMNAVAFKKVCKAVTECQTEYMARGVNFLMISTINRAFDNIQEAQKGVKKQQKGTIERASGKV